MRSYRDFLDFVVTKNGQHSNECCSQCTFLNNPALIVVEVAIVPGSNRLDNIVLDEIIQVGDQAYQLEAVIYHGSDHYILRSKNSNDCIFELNDMTRNKICIGRRIDGTSIIVAVGIQADDRFPFCIGGQKEGAKVANILLYSKTY